MLTAVDKRTILARVHVPELIEANVPTIADLADRIMARSHFDDPVTKSDVVELLVDARSRILAERYSATGR